MSNAKPTSLPLGSHYDMTKTACPNSEEEKAALKEFPYDVGIETLMYAWFVQGLT